MPSSPLPSPRPRFAVSPAAAWTLLWTVLAVLHVTQGIWRSGGAAYPGDLGDGRFNQLVLEHGYQSLRGVYEWSSPAQFHPVQSTLGFSDTHAGTLPFYAVLRIAGLSMDRAWQGWFVLVAIANALAASRLFAALGLSWVWRGPLVFAATSSAIMVWATGTHMQLLPIFPALLAWSELVRWLDDRHTRRLAAASGWLAWQFAAGPYLAFFATILTAAVGAARFVAGRCAGPGATAVSRNAAKPPRWFVTGIPVAIGGTLALVVARVYQHGVQAGLSRSMIEVESLAPRWQSWFAACPAYAWYPSGWFAGSTNLVEHAWFPGFLPWLLALAALALGWRERRTRAGQWMLAGATGVVVTMAFFTRWGAGGVSAWVWLAGHVEPLRAFRASGRIAVLLQVVLVAVAGLVLASVASRARWVARVAAALLLVEGVAGYQPVEQLAVAEARATAVIEAWRAAGDRPVLALALGPSNQNATVLHLDAWSAALRRQRATLNGFSGGQPGSHHPFLWQPTVAKAEALLAQLEIDPTLVSIVDDLSPATEAALGIQRLSGQPVAGLEGFDLQPYEWRLFAPLESWPIEGVAMYQFTPAAEVKFRLPDTVSRIAYLTGFRPDAYSVGGQTDGAGLTWLVQFAGGDTQVLSQELLTPLSRPDHRGLLARKLDPPPGRDRVLILRTDTGPAGHLPWDFLLLGRLHIRE